MEARINLARLTRKLLNKYEYVEASRARVVRRQIKDKSEIAHRRLRNLTMKLIVHDARKTSRKA